MRQGEVLSPTLFTIILNDIIKETKYQTKSKSKKISENSFAYDFHAKTERDLLTTYTLAREPEKIKHVHKY